MNKLIKSDPFRELADIQNRLTSLFGHEREDGADNGGLLAQADWTPAVDVSEDDDEYLITADLPDVNKDQVSVTVESGTLTITGERSQEKEKKDKQKKFHRVERSYGKYLRTFRVPDDVATDDLKADFKNGVLKVHLPKSEEKKPRSFDVKVN